MIKKQRIFVSIYLLFLKFNISSRLASQSHDNSKMQRLFFKSSLRVPSLYIEHFKNNMAYQRAVQGNKTQTRSDIKLKQ